MKLTKVPLLVLDAVNVKISQVAIDSVQVISKCSNGEIAFNTEFALAHHLNTLVIDARNVLLGQSFVSKSLHIVLL